MLFRSHPYEIEKKWFNKWLKDSCFSACETVDNNKTFSIVIPPPNVTGILTLGHVLNNSIQDILARRARMIGCDVLWLPGTDHAGIATQTKVELHLRKKRIDKKDLGREEFVQRVWDWKEKHGGIIIKQLQALGCSCDWQCERFTMDENYSRWVQFVFIDLFKKGKIYRGKRMVNWCPVSLTAISDEEVIMKTTQSKLYTIFYKIANSSEKINIATTRPETLMGDTAVAVHPNDKLYKHLIGNFALRPFPQKKIPIIADPKVEKDFGTGALKITPAHDKLDFEIGKAHKLPIIDILTEKGFINCPQCPDLHGLERFEAREKALQKLKKMKQLLKIEDYQNNIGYSERANVPIEPRLSSQWFLKYPSQEDSKNALIKKKIKFRPKHWEKTYAHWMNNLQDWCISRQLWWGHRIPVWQKKATLNNENYQDFFEKNKLNKLSENAFLKIVRTNDNREFSSNFSKEFYQKSQEYELFLALYDENEALVYEKLGFQQAEDVLDTWFSSWLWPFATMTAPPAKISSQMPQSKLLKKYFPTNDLITGPDIIFFWVARMIMASFEYYNQAPFKNVFFTSIVRDIKGRKMSKSLGNSPDPLELIKKYGADGLRFGLMRIAPLGQDIHFDEKQIEEGRNFATKIWNAARFRLMQNQPSNAKMPLTGAQNELIFIIDIISKLEQVKSQIEKSYQEYKFNEIANLLYQFFWTEFCDKFLETAKSQFSQFAQLAQNQQTELKKTYLAAIDYIFSQFLALIHPYMPFISEELWQKFGFCKIFNTPNYLMLSNLENIFSILPLKVFSQEQIKLANKNAEDLYNSIKKVRNLKADYELANKRNIEIIIQKSNKIKLIKAQQNTLKKLIGAQKINFSDKISAKNSPTIITEIGKISIPLEGLLDFETEKNRIDNELKKITLELKKTQQKLNNENFINRAPKEIIQKERHKQENWLKKRAKMQEILKQLG